MISQPSKRFLSVVVSVVFVVAALVIYFSFARPAYRDAQTVKAELLVKEEFLEAQQDAVKAVENLLKSEENKYQEVISKALPLRPDLAGILAQIKGITENNQIILKSMSFSAPGLGAAVAADEEGTSPPSPSEGLVKSLGRVNVNITMLGAYEDLKEFLADLESNIRVFNVESLSFSSPRPEGGLPVQEIYTYTLRATTYYQAP